MRHRPIYKFVKVMREEAPPKNIRSKLIETYESGGLKKFEEDVHLSKLKFRSIIKSKHPVMVEWVYVGQYWWCRKVGKRYNFGRFVAIYNDKECDKIDGIWDDDKHLIKDFPVIVYRGDNVSGRIVGFNEYDVFVRWDDCDVDHIVRDFGVLRFEFVEDFNRFRNVFSNLRANK